jgi:hypothetical protein
MLFYWINQFVSQSDQRPLHLSFVSDNPESLASLHLSEHCQNLSLALEHVNLQPRKSTIQPWPGLTGLPSLSQLMRGGGSPVATHVRALVVP